MTELENGITKLGCVNHDCEKCKARAEQEPMIDKSAAIRIATSLGWSPQRTWVGLTEEELWDLWNSHTEHTFPEWFVDFKLAHQVIEAKLKEKNT